MADLMPTSWVPIAEDSDFPLSNLPFGIFGQPGENPRAGVAIGDQIFDLAAAHDAGILDIDSAFVRSSTLNRLIANDRAFKRLRSRVNALLTAGNKELRKTPNHCLVDQASVQMKLPVAIGDYVDFYSSLEHASNVGRMFRPDDPPLLPNWRHLPIGYHGRSSTISVSGTPVHRPSGQTKSAGSDPAFGPSTKLDVELEVGFVTGAPSDGPVPVDDAEDHIAGLVLVNDWSARDLQAWEYRPLGPFLGKSFATTISPWLVTMGALEPYRTPGPPQQPPPLTHLSARHRRGIDVNLEVDLNGTIISRTNFKDMYWTMAQQLAHVTSNGTGVRSGDLYASGTVSGTSEGSLGSLLEMSWNGSRPIRLDDGSERTFLEDGDTVTLRAWCGGDELPRIGFGECTAIVLPAD